MNILGYINLPLDVKVGCLARMVSLPVAAHEIVEVVARAGTPVHGPGHLEEGFIFGPFENSGGVTVGRFHWRRHHPHNGSAQRDRDKQHDADGPPVGILAGGGIDVALPHLHSQRRSTRFDN